MNNDAALFSKRIRHLSIALITSGILNVGVLSLLLYWVLRERPPTPYCELRPARVDQQELPVADNREGAEALAHLSTLSFEELKDSLSHSRIIENGFAERDLALACMASFHHFDVLRAFPKHLQPQQKRRLSWKPKGKNEPISLVVYPGLSDHQFATLALFATNEKWPYTAEGLFNFLKDQKKRSAYEEDLIDTFALTSEFWTIELLFNRPGLNVKKHEILFLLLDGEWSDLHSFTLQQRQINDSSDARRQKFLLDYLNKNSVWAAALLLKNEWEFALKKLSDEQVIKLLKVMPPSFPEGGTYAREILVSPRSSIVWKEATTWLQKNSREPITNVLKPVTDARVAIKPPTAAISSTPTVYIVQEKDSLWKISKKFGVKIDAIKKLNNMSSDILRPGAQLKIPPAST